MSTTLQVEATIRRLSREESLLQTLSGASCPQILLLYQPREEILCSREAEGVRHGSRPLLLRGVDGTKQKHGSIVYCVCPNTLFVVSR